MFDDIDHTMHDDAYASVQVFRVLFWLSTIATPFVPIVYFKVHPNPAFVLLGCVCMVFLMANIAIFSSMDYTTEPISKNKHKTNLDEWENEW